MSYQETNRVYAAKLSVPKHRVMLALADQTPHGGKTYPSDATIAWMTDYSPKQVRRIKKACEEDGILVKITDARHHKPAIYELHPEVAPQKVPLRVDTHMSTLDNERVDTHMSTLKDDSVDISDPSEWTSQTGRVDISEPRVDIAVSPRVDIQVSTKQERTEARN